MSWRERLQTAKYRGVSFLTDDHEVQFGNRLVIHEFPGGNVSNTEDLGTKAPEWHVNAYVLGANYDVGRDKLLSVLAIHGPQYLRHPWLGKLLVYPFNWTLTESNEQGGFCKISIVFVPGFQGPGAKVVDKADKALSKAKGVKATAKGWLAMAKMASGEVSKFVAAVQAQLDKVRTFIAIATLPLTWASQLYGVVGSIKSELHNLLALPGSYANAVVSLFNVVAGGQFNEDFDVFGLFGSSSAANSSPASVSSILDSPSFVLADVDRPRFIRLLLALLPVLDAPTVALAKLDVPPSVAVLEFNLAHEKVFRAVLIVASAVELALVDYRAAADRDLVLGLVVDAIDGLLPSLPDVLFSEVLLLRTAVIEALADADYPDVVHKSLLRPLPAVVLAHRLDVDIDILISHNKVKHPLFVQGDVHA